MEAKVQRKAINNKVTVALFEANKKKFPPLRL